MGITIERSKLSVSAFGNPKKVLGMDGDTARYLIGTIIGTADGIKLKKSQDTAGNAIVHEAITGNFEGIPADKWEVDEEVDGVKTKVQIDGVRSGILYLPSGIHERLSSALKGDDVQPIKFAIECYSIKARNAAGYTYDVKAIMDAAASDPLAEMRKALAGKLKVLQIAAPKATKAA